MGLLPAGKAQPGEEPEEPLYCLPSQPGAGLLGAPPVQTQPEALCQAAQGKAAQKSLGLQRQGSYVEARTRPPHGPSAHQGSCLQANPVCR